MICAPSTPVHRDAVHVQPLPRVLLVTAEPPQSGTAGGIALQRLFSDYPADRLLVISNARVPAGASTLGCKYVHHPLAVDRLHRTRFWPWRNRLSVAGLASLLPLGRPRRAAQAFQPDVVLTLFQDSWYYTLAARLAAKLSRPQVVLIHDLPHLFEPVSPPLQPRQIQRDVRLLKAATARLFISDGMQRWCRQHYDVDGDVLLPPAGEQRDRAVENPEHLREPGRLTLGYAGGLHYGYGEQLLRLLPALRSTGTRLHLFTDRPQGSVAALARATDVVTWRGRQPTPDATWQRVVEECDVVLQPYLNPAGPHALQYRTHFPSKLGDLLALGRPVLMTGPEDASGIAWCRAHPSSAYCITSEDPAAVAEALLRLRNEPSLRRTFAIGATTASSAFAPAPLRAQLHEHLRRAAGLTRR